MDDIKELKSKLSFSVIVQKGYRDEGVGHFNIAEKCFENSNKWLREIKKLRKEIKKHNRRKWSWLQKLSGVMKL